MVAYGLAVGLLAALLFLSAGVEVPGDLPFLKRPFYRAAYYLLKKIGRGSRHLVGTLELEQTAGVLMAAALGLAMTLPAQLAASGAEALIDGNRLARPEKGQGEQRQKLLAEIEGVDQTEELEILVAEREYTREERREFLAQAAEGLEEQVLGENASADEVRQRIYLPERLADGHVTVEWTQDPAGILDAEGFPTEEALETLGEEGVLLQLRAVLTCEGEESICEFALRILPPLYSKEEQLLHSLQAAVKKADEDSAARGELTLPQEVEGHAVTWREPKSSVIAACLGITALAALGVWLGKKQEARKKEETRKRQLILDYPDLLFKLSMLLGAGLTLQNAFCRIALEYRARHEGEARAAYEEMLTACYEMRSGTPEARAYENFGRRCHEPGYVKLGTMLSSNLQKGSEGLAGLLQELAATSMEERRQMAKKLGEEAGTKLLMPMVLMLLVVLVILIVPAVMAF